MRRRLVLAFVALAVLVVALYGVPRAFIRIDQVHDREQEQVDQSVQLLADLVAAEARSGTPITPDLLGADLRPGERVEYVAPDGTTVTAGDPEGREAGVDATAPVAGGGSVTLDYAQSAIDRRIQAAILPLLTIGLLLVALALLAALVLAHRLARPFQELAGHARSLGSGHFDLDVPHYDVPEAEEVGQALLTSARSLDHLVRRERDFTVNASHELRTPLTAARLRLEDLALWPTTSPETAAEITEILQEVDRMDAAVAALLERDRAQRATADDVDLVRLVVAAAHRWRAPLDAQDRDLTVVTEGDLRARVEPGPVDEVLDVLLERAVQHGEGQVAVTATRTPDYLEVRVGDESRRTHGTEVLRPSDADPSSPLPHAAELAAALGGNLTVGTGTTRSFVLRLPAPTSGI